MAAADCGGTTSITEMSRYQLGFNERLLQDFGSLQRDKMVACTVEPVFPEPVLFVIFVWYRVVECVGRKCLMECGVEDGDLRFSWKQFRGNSNALCRCWIVQRRQFRQFFDP